MLRFLTTLILISLSIQLYETAKILCFVPLPLISHQFVFRPFTQELAKRGHHVTIVTADPAFPKGKAPNNITEIDLHDMSYEVFQSVYATTSTGKPDLVTNMKFAFEVIDHLLEKQFQLDVIKNLMKEKFDLVFVQACARPALVLSHIFKAPLIMISSFGAMNFDVNIVGAAWHPSLYPMNMSKRVYNLTTWEKIKELWTFYRLEKALAVIENKENAMLKNVFGPNAPPMSDLKDNVDMIFLNAHTIWERNRPIPPNVIYMGGISVKPEKELPKDIKKYLDSSKNGVVYMSFGTNIKPTLLPKKLLNTIIEALSSLNYDVLWKFEEELSSRNIKTFKWMPQSDILRHPKVKVFITHGGLQSTDEAIIAGVPLVGIPMNSDQYYNVEQYTYHDIGVQLDIENLSVQNFVETVNKVVENTEHYQRNIIELKSLLYDQPMPPLETAVWWTEYVLRHGSAKHLRTPGANITWTQYLELELVFTVLTVLFVLLLVILVTSYLMWTYIDKKIAFNKKIS